MSTLTQERLKELYQYNPDTGIFTGNKRGTPITNNNSSGYIRIGIDGKTYRAHRLAWLYMKGEWPHSLIDHINMVKSDNSFVNLREADKRSNSWNRPKQSNNSSGFKGVSQYKRGSKWVAETRLNKKKFVIGYFNTPEEASEAYQRFTIEHHGEFHNSNVAA